MRVLLAIGEGLRTAGVNQLRQSLLDSGFGVVMIGADGHGPKSASSRPDKVDSVGDDPHNPVFELDGSLTDSVQFAIGSGLIDQADVVIAGLHPDPLPGSYGPRSPLAAAMEAAAMARPAIALEIDECGEIDACGELQGGDARFAWCGVVLSELAAFLGVSPLPVPGVLHVRVPARLAGRAIHLDGEVLPGRPTHLTLSAMALDETAGRSLAPLQDWTRRAINTINPRLGVTTAGCEVGCCG